MTDGAEENEPSAFNVSRNSLRDDKSVPRKIPPPDEPGPGRVGVALSWTKSRIRDLDIDKTISREERDLLRLYYNREREKLQLKLRVFGEVEKIKAFESVILRNQKVQGSKAASERSMADEGLVKARSELKKTSAALERLCGHDAAWEKPGASARRWEGSQKWQAITPEELQPATEAIRHKVEHHGFWQSRQSTMKLCYAALHPAPSASGQTEAENLAPYKQFLVALLGQRIESMFSGSDRLSPLIFKSYLDVLEAAMKVFVRVGFQELFEIAKARHDVLGMHPVEWAKRHVEILISAEKSRIRFWTKQVCDPLDYSKEVSDDDSFYWGHWRAPRLIHMEPAGNTRFDKEGAWVREDLVKSEELLDARAELTTDFLRFDLEKSVRAAHVEFVKRSTPKPHAPYPGESIRRAPTFAKATPFTEPLAPDVWRNLHDRFKALAEEELTLAPQSSGDRWLCAYVDSKDTRKTCGQWHLSNSIHESFRERFEVEATRAGIALDSHRKGKPLTLWLHRLYSDLLQHKSKMLFSASEECGVILRVCEASALYCARLEKQALIEGRMQPGESAAQTRIAVSTQADERIRNRETIPHDLRAETLREAAIKKVQYPQRYTVLSNLEAVAYFEVKPRTLHRWIATGQLRSGPRRGSITIESVRRFEKQRSRKRQNG